MAKGMGRSSIIFALMTLISRVLGLLRDMLIARFFDASITDPFFAALRIPNTLRRFFAEGGFANAFVPVFSSTKAASPEELKALISHTLGVLLTILSVITLFGVIGSSTIISVVAHGLADKDAQFHLASTMLRIMFPYILLISLTAMAGGILNTYGQFAIPALTPALLNLTLIIACLWRYFYAPQSSGIELAWAVLAGGVLQLAIQLPFLYRHRLLCRPRWGWHYQGVRKIIKLMIPTLFGSSVGQLTILVNTFLASSLLTGSISWLYYSDRMVELPIALIGVALGVVILPRLSALKGKEDHSEYKATLLWSLRWALLLGSAASTGLFALAPSILTSLFYGGAFVAQDLMMTTHSLQAYAIAGVFLIMVKVLAPAFYARQDTKTPVKAGMIAMAVNMVSALVLSRFWGHVGLAGASTIASIINVILLLFFLQNIIGNIVKPMAGFILRLVLANGAMYAILYHLQGNIYDWLPRTRFVNFSYLLFIILVGTIAYFALLYLLGVRIKDLKSARS